MGKPLMIQEEDNEKIEVLKERMGAKTKIEVLRSALTLLEEKVSREDRIKRWKKAALAVGLSDMEVLREFQTKKRFEGLP